MQLSKRLAAVANMVTPGLILADIGTDHAYIPIDLVENHIVPHAIAADVNRGPLLRAEAHIREHGLEDRIETRLSDGLAALRPGEVQSIVIAGMGGALTVRILQNGAGLFEPHRMIQSEENEEAVSELILQPQSEIPVVRSYLEQIGWEIVREDMIFEDGKYYPMMKAKRVGGGAHSLTDNERKGWPESAKTAPVPAAPPMTDLQLEFGPRLLEVRHPVLREFLLREQKTQERILESLRQGKTESAGMRERAVRGKLRMIENALRLYEESEQ